MLPGAAQPAAALIVPCRRFLVFARLQNPGRTDHSSTCICTTDARFDNFFVKTTETLYISEGCKSPRILDEVEQMTGANRGIVQPSSGNKDGQKIRFDADVTKDGKFSIDRAHGPLCGSRWQTPGDDR